uniref:Cathepsin propeptide inhibitor domain-containing protein n=1 Tax=Glossina palpalis gambiensis TaxID=67801 RepID=A0A1B0B4E2_9MUSC
MTSVTDEEWITYKEKFNKNYKDEAEDKMRRETFARANQRIEEHNKKYEAGTVTYRMGHNNFSDHTEEEISRSRGVRTGH